MITRIILNLNFFGCIFQALDWKTVIKTKHWLNVKKTQYSNVVRNITYKSNYENQRNDTMKSI